MNIMQVQILTDILKMFKEDKINMEQAIQAIQEIDRTATLESVAAAHYESERRCACGCLKTE